VGKVNSVLSCKNDDPRSRELEEMPSMRVSSAFEGSGISRPSSKLREMYGVPRRRDRVRIIRLRG